MGLILGMAGVHIPAFMQKRNLDLLLRATADAFQVTCPVTGRLSYLETLEGYARFTRDNAQQTILRGDPAEVQSRLWQNTFRIGRQLHRDFHIRTAAETMRLGAIIYRTIKIDFQGDNRGNILIKRCFFSDYYSSEVCRLISFLDAGLLAGLSGGCKLSFRQRITEGNEHCRAYLEGPGWGK
jgi:hypothetical protein